MEKLDSISHFLQAGKFQYRIFDMGRKLIRMSNQMFQRIEAQQEAYPYPFQQKAWLALLFWEEGEQGRVNQESAIIWFLQFPIDELGFLKQDARDHFLMDLLEQTGKNIQAKQTGGVSSDELGESPFAFKPRPERLAMFHALAGKELNQEASQYYQHTREYLQGKMGYDQWQFLGLQGIADVVARLDSQDNDILLKDSIPEMPTEPLLNFAYALENVKPQGLLAESLITRLRKELALGKVANVVLIAALVRALSGSLPEKRRRDVLLEVIGSSFASEIEVLAAISGRAWKDLVSLDLLVPFITKLAGQDQAVFNAILADLMMIPGMRETVFTVLRDPQRPESLGKKVGEFMKVLHA